LFSLTTFKQPNETQHEGHAIVDSKILLSNKRGIDKTRTTRSLKNTKPNERWMNHTNTLFNLVIVIGNQNLEFP
jgi:hypothetical protein